MLIHNTQLSWLWQRCFWQALVSIVWHNHWNHMIDPLCVWFWINCCMIRSIFLLPNFHSHSIQSCDHIQVHSPSFEMLVYAIYAYVKVCLSLFSVIVMKYSNLDNFQEIEILSQFSEVLPKQWHLSSGISWDLFLDSGDGCCIISCLREQACWLILESNFLFLFLRQDLTM